MKICFLAHAASIHTRRWMQYFRDRGHEVSVVTLTPAEQEPGIEMYDLQHHWPISYERTNWHYLLRLPDLWRVIRRIRPDIVNAHFLSSYGLLAALIRPASCPLVISLHGSDILLIPKRSLLHRWAAHFALSRADLVTSVAQHMTQGLYQYVSQDKPVLTLQYGVDAALFHPVQPEDPPKPVCLSNRSMVPTGNVEAVLLAARHLKDQGSPIQIKLAGDGEQLPFLQQKASELDLEDRVSFLGRIDHNQMPELLRSVSLYTSMSLSDGTSLSLMEAMACGAFPVVSDIPANREWITHGVNGYLVPPCSPELLAQRLSDAWNRPELRRAAAEQNWALIREKGDYQKNMRVIESKFIALAAK